MTAVHLILDEGLGNASWLVELGDGRALVVDPQRDPAPYLGLAGRLGAEVAFSAETHLHADFVTGSRELAAAGATVLAPQAAGIAWPHRPLRPGDDVDLGGLRLRVLGTPGHTPEHIAYLLCDGARPRALFSGGSLLVGAVARTDLIAPDRTETLARQLWRSLHEHVLGLPDDVAVYPTHGTGSFCAPATIGERHTTIGAERRTNPLLAAGDEDTFVERLLGGMGSYPPYFLELREVNRLGPAVVGTPFPGLPSLRVEEVRHLIGGGGALIDVRPISDFAAGHLPGSVSIALRPVFATWLGWLVERRRDLVFVLGAGQDRAELVRQCLSIGYERVAGELNGGINAWSAAGLPLATLALESAERLAPAAVLDVRQRSEFESGHVPGALHVELGALTDAVARLPDGPLTVHCAHGERAMTAASLLARAGRQDVAVVAGGPDQLAAARHEQLV